jgi:uncharacterized spore protein YtfJ
MTETQSQGFMKTMVEAVGRPEQVDKLMNRLLDVAEPGKVFSAPVHSGDYTIITASEVSANVGYGYGFGGGSGSAPSQQKEDAPEGETEPGPSGEGGGGGGGGAGATFGRPVAVIVAGPDGVKVTPIVDPTKIALAWFTMFGAMFIALGQMRKQAQKFTRRKA